jgi:hypothetical protein
MDLSPTQPIKFILRPIPLGVKQPKREAVNLIPLVPRLRMLGSFYFTSPHLFPRRGVHLNEGGFLSRLNHAYLIRFRLTITRKRHIFHSDMTV